jgi:hypothetical protein
MLIIEDRTMTVKGGTNKVTNSSKDRGTHGVLINRQMI